MKQRGMVSMATRHKLSTTISAESYEYLESLIRAGRAQTFAEAVDRAIEAVRRLDNRRRLERDTSLYFNTLSAEAASEETELAAALSDAAALVSFDE